MIDVLPTLLDMTGLEPPGVSQGQSLVPLLLGENGWVSRPVIFDQARTVDLANPDIHHFHIEVVDGRWGASLLVPVDPRAEPQLPDGRSAALLVYDLWNDPDALTPINDERPDLVGKYREFLEAQWEAHQALAHHVGTAGEEVPLTPEQLGTLRTLGYIR